MSNSAGWDCPSCGESIERHFTYCWNCGSDRAGRRDPDYAPAVTPLGERLACDNCGYLLQGLRDHVCPECGEEFDPDVRDTAIEPANLDANKRLSAFLFRLVTILALLAFGLSASVSMEDVVPFVLAGVFALIVLCDGVTRSVLRNKADSERVD